MQVGTLINNVGLSYDHPDYLATLDDTFIRQIIEINCLATTKVGCRAEHPGWSTSTWSKSGVAYSVQLLHHGELPVWLAINVLCFAESVMMLRTADHGKIGALLCCGCCLCSASNSCLEPAYVFTCKAALQLFVCALSSRSKQMHAAFAPQKLCQNWACVPFPYWHLASTSTSCWLHLMETTSETTPKKVQLGRTVPSQAP